MKLCMPEETHCPNCGKFALCGHSSSGTLRTESGSYGSTLYGVCQECADNHGAYFDSMNHAARAQRAGKGGE